MNGTVWEVLPDAILLPGLRSDGFVFAVSTVAAGDMHIATGDSGRAARESFVRTYGMGLPLVCGNQIHGNRIEILTETKRAIFEGTDGCLVPQGVSVAAGVFTADCLAICLLDRRRREFVLVHSGWRGTQAGLPLKALRLLESRGTRMADLRVVFAPSIQPCCYEVGPEFREHFPDGPFREQHGQLFFDNQGAAAGMLLSAGVPVSQIDVSPWCTVCDSERRFWSWRRQGQTAGRMMTIVAPIET
ncbi:MAG TPA: polyphenol oxidase family protein [Spirochaetota bacterium]|nr:polyphenol oxidase family protein [Spirochaetota bacterium]